MAPVEQTLDVVSEQDYELLDGIPNTSYDFSRAAICVISIGLVVAGSYRSVKLDHDRAKGDSSMFCGSPSNGPQFTVITSWQAVLLPIMASCSLLMMFLFFDSLQFAFALAAAVLATVAFAFLLQPICQSIVPGVRAEILSGLLALILVGCWLATGHWLFMDLLGMALSIAFIALVRLPSLKVSSLLLVGLLIYDIFWVFFSASLFSTNVMVRVATRPAENPLAALASRLNLPRPPRLSLPGKLVFPAGGTSSYVVSESDNDLASNVVVAITSAISAVTQSSLLSDGGDGASANHAAPFHPSHNSASRTHHHQHRRVRVLHRENSGSTSFAILGLGDIVMPGLLLCFVLRYDAYKKLVQTTAAATNAQQICAICQAKIQSSDPHNSVHHSQSEPLLMMEEASPCSCVRDGPSSCQNKDINSPASHFIPVSGNPGISFKSTFRRSPAFLSKITYFHCSLIGYILGLLTATACSEFFNNAQPALLYLVPFTLLPLIVLAYVRGDLYKMWHEPFISFGPHDKQFHI